MRAELRPSSLGEILDRTAQMYRSHFLLYFGIASVSYSAVLVLSLFTRIVMYSHIHAGGVRRPDRIMVTAGFSIGLFSMLPIAVAMAAVIYAVARNYLGHTCTIREAYASIGRRWYRYILILLAMDTYAMLPILVLAIVIGVTSVLLPRGMARGPLIALAMIMVLAGIFFACWCLLRWALSIPASLMEELTVHRALKRSSVLTKGSLSRIFVMLLLVVAVMMVIQYAIQIPMFLLLWKSRGQATLPTQILASLGTFLSGSFVLPIYSIALTLFYYDQRIRKEGYDVEWLMEQAAVSPVAAPPGALFGAAAGTLTPQTDPFGPAV
jgi:hypothetical protein